MARGEMEGIIWLDDFAFVPKNIASVINTGSAKVITLPTANTETKFMSKLINLQLLEHNNKERIKKLVRSCAYDGK
jgi:hypothetical protein